MFNFRQLVIFDKTTSVLDTPSEAAAPYQKEDIA